MFRMPMFHPASMLILIAFTSGVITSPLVPVSGEMAEFGKSSQKPVAIASFKYLLKTGIFNILDAAENKWGKLKLDKVNLADKSNYKQVLDFVGCTDLCELCWKIPNKTGTRTCETYCYSECGWNYLTSKDPNEKNRPELSNVCLKVGTELIIPDGCSQTSEFFKEFAEKLTEDLKKGLTEGLTKGLTKGLTNGLSNGLSQGLKSGLARTLSGLADNLVKLPSEGLVGKLVGGVPNMLISESSGLADGLVNLLPGGLIGEPAGGVANMLISEIKHGLGSASKTSDIANMAASVLTQCATSDIAKEAVSALTNPTLELIKDGTSKLSKKADLALQGAATVLTGAAKSGTDAVSKLIKNATLVIEKGASSEFENIKKKAGRWFGSWGK